MNKFTKTKTLVFGLCSAFAATSMMAQSFTNSNTLLTPTTMRSGNCVAVVDVNGDGLDDIVRMHQSTDLYVDLQQRSGSFTTYNLGNITGTNRIWGMAIADIDHNGWKDVICGPNGSVYLVKLGWSGSTMTKTSAVLPNSNFFTQNITCGDFNKDGWNDVYVCDDNAYAKVYMNDGAGNLTFLAHSTTSMTIGTGSKSLTVQTGLNFTAGQPIKVGYDGQNYMSGTVTSYTSGTGALVVNITSVVGSGTYGTWSAHRNVVFNHQLSTTTYGGDPADSGNYGSAWVDFDNDGDLDLFVPHCRQASSSTTDLRRKDRLFVNDGNGNFTDMAATMGIEATAFNQTWTSSFADIDNDGDFDVILTYHDIASKILENDGTGHYTDITGTTGFSTTGAGTQPIESHLEDFDNDGFVDIFVTGSDYIMYHNNGNKTFTLVNTTAISSTGGMVSFATGDLNHDGFMDIFASYGDIYNAPSSTTNDVLYLNNKNANHFLSFNLTGTVSNHDAIGTRVTIYGPWGKQIREVRSGESYGTVNTFQVHFGLGSNTTVDSIRINWPSGLTNSFSNVAADQFITVVEGTCSIVGNIIPGPYALCTGQTLTLTANSGYSSYAWNTGATTQSVTTGTTGNFSVLVTSGACSNISPTAAVVLNPDETPSITSAGTNNCAGNMTLTSTPAASYSWSGPGGFTATTQTITPPQAGNYTVTIAGTCGPFTSSAFNANVTAAPAPTGTGATGPAGSYTISATGTGGTLTWYDAASAGTNLGTGGSYTTPVLSATTSYWVEESTTYPGAISGVGPKYHSGSNFFSGNTTNSDVQFNVFANCTLKTVKVFTDTPGNREIQLKNSGGTVLNSLLINLIADTTIVTLNWPLTVGTGYSLTTNATVNNSTLGTTSPRLLRSNTGVSYPYVLAGKVTLTGSNQGSTVYYYFYDWKLEDPSVTCTSARTQVDVVITPTTGIVENTTGTIFVYPNPANNVLNVQFATSTSKATVIEVMDITGRVVGTWSFENVTQGQTSQLEIGSLTSGTYLLNIKNENGSSVQKLVVTK
jgi:hypothetical protein